MAAHGIARPLGAVSDCGEDSLRLALDAAGIGTWDWNIDTDEGVWSDRCKSLFGFPPDKRVDYRGFIESVHPDDRAGVEQAVERALAAREDYDVEMRMIRPDGTIRWVAVAGHALYDAGGKPLRMVGVARDVTGRRETEAAGRLNEQRLRLFIEHAPAAIAVFDRSMRYVAVSRRWLADYGLGDRDIVGLSHYEVFPEISERWKEIHRHCLAGDTAMSEEEPFPRLDGRIDWVRWEVLPWHESSGEIGGIIMFTEVVTARKIAEEALKDAYDKLELRVRERTEQLARAYEELKEETGERKKAEENLRQLAAATENAAEAIVITDRHFNITYVNPAFTEISGYGPEEVGGRNISILRVGRRERLLDEGICIPVPQEGRLGGVYPMQRKDGRVRCGRAHISAIKEGSGSAAQYVIIIDDITEQLRLEEQLRQAQKMEAIGTLAGGIAHDFNNILAIVLGNAELALDRLVDTDLYRNIEQIIQATGRGRELVKQILTFSRKTSQLKKTLHLRRLIEETCTLLRASFPGTIDIHFDIQTDADTILGDETQIQRVLMNLVTNAAQAVKEEGGRIVVGLSAAAVRPDSVFPGTGIESGNYVQLTVKDTGAGMSEEVQKRAFEPFFTTKGVGQGSGMGLSVVYGIVKSHGGTVVVESEAGKGTLFSVFLPAHETREEPVEERQSALPKGHERILFVDDEEPIVEMAGSVLERLGYEVTGVTNSVQAWAAFREDPRRFDLMIADQTMPDLTGLALARNMMEVRRDFPVVLITGYSDAVSPEIAREAGVRELVMKPLTKRELAETIRRILDERDRQ